MLEDPQRDLLDPCGLARDVMLVEPPKQDDPPHVVTQRQISLQLQASVSAETRRFLVDFAKLPVDALPTAEQQKRLMDVVNGWIAAPGLFNNVDLDPLKPKLTKQSLDLLKDLPQLATKLPDMNRVTRLHRSILEVAYPGRIRQVLGDGWPPVLMIYGVIGVVVAVVFFLFHRDTPRQHFLTNGAEADLAEAHEKAKEDAGQPIPAYLWWSILTDRSLWASSLVQFGTNFGWIILGNQLALYLFEVHRIPEGAERSWMASLPFLVALPTLIVGGWWTDWMTKKYGPRVGRCFPIASTRFATAVAFAFCYFLDGAWPVVIALSAMSIVHDMGLPAIWGYNLDVGKRNVGLVLGWGNMWGNLGAFVSPIVLLPLTDAFATKKEGYNALFLVCCAVFIVIGILSLFIDASKPIGVVLASASETSTGIRAGEPPIQPEAR
jgi:sugar phosphate permease